MPEFIPGLKLGELFYKEIIEPFLRENFPGLEYSAALLGSGSEILGYDTAQSTDHHWGPRLLLFLRQSEIDRYKQAIRQLLSEKLPCEFYGYSTNFGEPDSGGVQLLEKIENGPVNHRVEIVTIGDYFQNYLGVDPYKTLETADWLTLPEQKLLTVTSGQVYHDGLNELNSLRQKYAYYPHQIWLYLLSAQWDKLAQEEAFMARCGVVGDELGSQLVAARLAHNLMKLCFLMEKKYAPYTKWFGTAFSRLECSQKLAPVLQAALKADDWQERENYLVAAYETVAELHNKLGITTPLEAKVSNYHNRPYRVIHAERFSAAIFQTITDTAIKNLEFPAGAIDQFIDSTQVLAYPQRYTKIRSLFD